MQHTRNRIRTRQSLLAGNRGLALCDNCGVRNVASSIVALWVVCLLLPLLARAQTDQTSSRNLNALFHIDTPAVAVDVDQDPERPYAYVATSGEPGFAIVSLADGSMQSDWRPMREGTNASDVGLFKLDGNYVVAIVGGKSMDLVDVSNIRKPTLIRTVQLDATSESPRVFAYRHSSGRAIIATASGQAIRLYDAKVLVSGGDAIAEIVTPELLERGTSGFDYVYAQYHLETGQDRLYGGGAGGYHVFDITNPNVPVSIVSVNPATIARGQVVAPTPDGRYIVTTANYQWSPVRIFDMKPMFDGEVRLVRTSESAWTPNWKGLTRAVEVRWPLVFTASSGDGLQVFNMRDPASPYTVGYFGSNRSGLADVGAYDVDVRDVDGTIVVAFVDTGIWVVRLDEMQSWNGNGYGQVNVSSAQQWDAGPDMTGPE